jgi:hypothetical protein
MRALGSGSGSRQLSGSFVKGNAMCAGTRNNCLSPLCQPKVCEGGGGGATKMLLLCDQKVRSRLHSLEILNVTSLDYIHVDRA